MASLKIVSLERIGLDEESPDESSFHIVVLLYFYFLFLGFNEPKNPKGRDNLRAEG